MTPPSQQLLLPDYVVPVRPANTVLEQHAVLVQDEEIAAIMPRSPAIEAYPGAPRVELPGHVLLPGLINMHTHSPMTLLRGLADDLALDTWLKDHIWPAEARALGPEFIRQGTELAIAEMLRGGTTCFNENYFFPDVIAETVAGSGMRACIGLPVIDFPTPWAQDVKEYLAKAERLHEQLSGQPRIRTTLAPHSMYTVSDEGLAQIAAWSEAWDVRVHQHVLEIAWEAQYSRQQHGKSALERLAGLGLLNERLLAVHMVHLDQRDIERVAETGVRVVHCPESNLKLASGLCPVADLLKAGASVSVGTDGAASNNDLNLLAELHTASLLAKGVSGDASTLPAYQALDMITIGAAEALGLETEIGSIEPGKQADLCALDLRFPQTQPVHNVISQVVYAASASQFSHVWVAGACLLEQGQLTCMDEAAVLARAAEWSKRLRPGHA